MENQMEMTEMGLTPLHDPERGQMRVAGLMSGSGTNLRRIIELERRMQDQEGKALYIVAAISTDRPDSKAGEIGKEYGIPVVINDIKEFYRSRNKPRKDMETRAEYDAQTVRALSRFDIDVAAYAGYMNIATKPLIEAYLGINVHPADLSIRNPDWRRRYTGHKAVLDAIAQGETHLRSSVHIVTPGVDEGAILMRSSPIEVNISATERRLPDGLESAAERMQNALKERGDWIIFPKTLLLIAQGRFAKDGSGNIYFDHRPVPYGITPEELP